MRGKTFLILLAAAGVLVALAWLRFGEKESAEGLQMGDKLFADLPVNAVASVTIADAENQVVLVKGDKVWQVEARNGYPADFDELRNLVLKLSRLKIGRSFSGSPESLGRLSLLAPSAANASGSGQQITLKDGSGKILADVILGKNRETDSGGSGGQYLKTADSDTVLLVDGSFRFLKTGPADWLKKEILNIQAADVAAVTCYAGDAPIPVYTLSRPEKGADARLTPVPEGRTADQTKIDQVLDALAPLTLDDVHAGSSNNPPAATAGRFRLVYRLYDGRLIALSPFHDDKTGYYTLRVAAEESEAETGTAEKSGESAGKEKSREDRAAAESEPPSPSPPTAQQLNEALGPWIFSIKKWQFDSLITQPDLLLEAVKKEAKADFPVDG